MHEDRDDRTAHGVAHMSLPVAGPARDAPLGHRLAFRRSPVSFGATPAATESRDGWTVTLRYESEDGHPGPFLVDLSHRPRWDYQDSRVATHRPMGLPVPERFGGVGVHDPLVINRMNRTQVAIWHLGDGRPPSTPPEPGFTDTGDGHCMLAFVGAGVPEVLEHLTPLDLFDPARPAPFLTQGPVLHVPCQVVTFAARPGGDDVRARLRRDVCRGDAGSGCDGGAAGRGGEGVQSGVFVGKTFQLKR